MLRVLIAVAALLGWSSAMSDTFRTWGWRDALFFSQISCLAAGLVALAAVVSHRQGRDLGWWRGATTTYCTVTLLVFAILLARDYASLASKLEHLAVPVLVMIEWVLVPPRGIRWWWPVAWLVPPLLYLPVYVWACRLFGHPLYGFLDPDSPSFLRWFVILLCVFGVVGAMWAGVGALRSRRRGRPAAAAARG